MKDITGKALWILPFPLYINKLFILCHGVRGRRRHRHPVVVVAGTSEEEEEAVGDKEDGTTLIIHSF